MPDCVRQIRTYCRQCDVPLCIEDDGHGGKTCFEKFHTKRLFEYSDDDDDDAASESSEDDGANTGEDSV